MLSDRAAELVRNRAGLLLVLGAVAFAAFLLYLPTVDYGFVWDDLTLITGNRLLADSGPWELFGRGFWAGAPDAPGGPALAYYRPLANLSFWADLKIAGANPGWFHLVNVILNALVAVLVALVVWELLHSGVWAGLAGLFFAAHSAHVESVAFVSGRTDLLLALFVTAGAFALLRSLRTRKPGWLAVVPFACAAALLSKETAVLFPVLVAVAPLLTRTGYPRRYWLMVSSVLAITAGYLVLRAWAVGAVVPAAEPAPFIGRMLEVANTFGLYVRMFLWPFNHRVKFPLDPAFATPRPETIVALLFVVSLPLLALRRRFWVVLWGYVWTIIFVLPVTNIVALGPQAAERLLYLPSVGLTVAGVTLLSRAFASASRMRRAAAALLLVFAAVLAWDSLRRSPVWRDEPRLFSAMVRESPNAPSAWTNLANVVRDEHPDSALALYDRALRLDQGHVRSHINAGILASQTGDHRRAIHHLRSADELEPGSARVLSNLGLAFLASGEPESALVHLDRAVAADPHSPAVLVNRAAALAALGQTAEAGHQLRGALEVDPGFVPGLLALAAHHEALANHDSAAAALERAARHQPRDPSIHNRLGTMLVCLGDSSRAARHYERALELDPGFVPALYNHAILIAAFGDSARARALALRAARLRPDLEPVTGLCVQLGVEPGR
ncbi:tetratricopeptide repeat protein [candidate division WOR-3 bacterium]|nr:tetratricopeptide repeat protein [candidate division WOR-3 bacterium]